MSPAVMAKAACLVTPIQFSIFDSPEKVKHQHKEAVKRDLNHLHEIAGKQINRRAKLELWVKRSIVRGWLDLHARCEIPFEKWWITPLPSMGNKTPCEFADTNWEGMSLWMREVRQFALPDRIEEMQK